MAALRCHSARLRRLYAAIAVELNDAIRIHIECQIMRWLKEENFSFDFSPQQP